MNTKQKLGDVEVDCKRGIESCVNWRKKKSIFCYPFCLCEINSLFLFQSIDWMPKSCARSHHQCLYSVRTSTHTRHALAHLKPYIFSVFFCLVNRNRLKIQCKYYRIVKTRRWASYCSWIRTEWNGKWMDLNASKRTAYTLWWWYTQKDQNRF